MTYKRIVLKLSGEALAPAQSLGISQHHLTHYADEITAAHQLGVELALVVGGGNFWRGKEADTLGISPTEAHYMGMLATMINSLALRDLLRQRGIPTLLMSRLPMPSVCASYNPIQAKEALATQKIVLLGGGLGSAFFSTDTAAITNALALDADVLLKGTKVEGVYPKDPAQHPESSPYAHISLSEVYEKKLKVMDITAIALADENNFPVIVYHAGQKGYLKRILQGEKLGTQLSNR